MKTIYVEKQNVESLMQKLILHIGEEIPASLAMDSRSKFVLIGTPQDFLDALSPLPTSTGMGYEDDEIHNNILAEHLTLLHERDERIKELEKQVFELSKPKCDHSFSGSSPNIPIDSICHKCGIKYYDTLPKTF